MRRSGGSGGAFAAAHVLVGAIAIVALAGTATVAPAFADAEQMFMPFQCTLELGRVVLTPASTTSYRLVGNRASHAFTSCAPANPDHCRTWQIHKFDFLCAGQRVPWLAVATAVLETAPQRGRIDNGRLMLRLGPQWQRRALVPAGFRNPFGEVDGLLAFPAGFAPALGTGIRFVGAPPPTVVDAKPLPKPDVKSARTGEAKPAAVTDPPRPAPARAAETFVGDGWATTVTVSQSSAANAAASSLVLRGLLAIAAVLAAWAGFVVIRRRAKAALSGPAVAGQPAPSSRTAAEADDAAVCAELVSRVVNLHQAARDAVGAVPNENLREILSHDLAAVQARLLSAELTENVADERWHAVKPAVTQALADLERIARIIAGVLSSQSTVVALTTPVVSVPETAQQAYEALGINPDASRTVVKKVVDGLRQSWHPDHARDDADRGRREERMKQINVAWGLIRAAHEPPAAERAA